MIAFRISVYPSRDSDAAPTVTATIKFDVRAGEGCHAAAKIFSLLPVGQPEFVHVDCSQSSGSRFKPLVDALASVPEIHFDCPSSVRLLLDGTPQMGAKFKSSGALPDFPLPGLKRIIINPTVAHIIW